MQAVIGICVAIILSARLRLASSQLDPCAGVNCPSEYICVQGACRPTFGVGPVIPAGACSSSPCLNDCVCVPSCKHADGYYCRSSNGYMGKNCDIAVPKVNCSADRITLSVSSEVLKEIYSDTKACLFVGGPIGERKHNDFCQVCSPTNGNYELTVFLPFNQCGMSSNITSSGSVLFSNLLWAGLRNHSLFDMPVPILSFNCEYDQEYKIVTSIRPTIEGNHPAINDSVPSKASLELCKISNACPSACPRLYSVRSGATYTISETIHVTVSVDSPIFLLQTSDQYTTILEKMYLSCSDILNQGDTKVVLVDHNCEKSILATRIDRMLSTSSTLCVSFKVPRLLYCPDSAFYIHAHLKIVKYEDKPNCNVDSLPVLRKSKRSIEFEQIVTAQSGPIFVIYGKDGVPNSLLFPNDDDDDDNEDPNELPDNTLATSSPGTSTEVIIGIVGVIVFIIAIVVIALCSYTVV